MHKKSILLTCFSLFIIVAYMTGCAGLTAKPSESNYKDPVVTLNYVDIAHYFGWWYFSPKVKPTKGKAGHNSAPLDYAFIFDIHNPNPYPVKLEDFKFLVALDGFELNSGYAKEAMWIPAGKTSQLKVEVMFDFRGTQLSLLIVAGQELKKKGMSFWAVIEKIWTQAPDFSFPIEVREGSAVFTAGGMTKVAAFSGAYPN
jgi:LEA14-like dessication related protein